MPKHDDGAHFFLPNEEFENSTEIQLVCVIIR